jgi:hypothetical protein
LIAYRPRQHACGKRWPNLPGPKNKEGGGKIRKNQEFFRQNYAGHPWLGNINKYSNAGSGSYFMRKGIKEEFK